MGYLKIVLTLKKKAPNRGFLSTAGKKPRNLATQSESCLGQLLKYMTTTNTAT
ncbi:hypothetical protein HAX54_014386, partial [Datura stramonium]|nr:hypothetical protein [Datura stramonium]